MLNNVVFPYPFLQEMSKLRSENEGLKQLRKQMDNEIEELTAALFQEAYKMVNGAHARRAGVEKQLQETRGKVLYCITHISHNPPLISLILN